MATPGAYSGGGLFGAGKPGDDDTPPEKFQPPTRFWRGAADDGPGPQAPQGFFLRSFADAAGAGLDDPAVHPPRVTFRSTVPFVPTPPVQPWRWGAGVVFPGGAGGELLQPPREDVWASPRARFWAGRFPPTTDAPPALVMRAAELPPPDDARVAFRRTVAPERYPPTTPLRMRSGDEPIPPDDARVTFRRPPTESRVVPRRWVMAAETEPPPEPPSVSFRRGRIETVRPVPRWVMRVECEPPPEPLAVSFRRGVAPERYPAPRPLVMRLAELPPEDARVAFAPVKQPAPTVTPALRMRLAVTPPEDAPCVFVRGTRPVNQPGPTSTRLRMRAEPEPEGAAVVVFTRGTRPVNQPGPGATRLVMRAEGEEPPAALRMLFLRWCGGEPPPDAGGNPESGGVFGRSETGRVFGRTSPGEGP